MLSCILANVGHLCRYVFILGFDVALVLHAKLAAKFFGMLFLSMQNRLPNFSVVHVFAVYDIYFFGRLGIGLALLAKYPILMS